MCNLIALVIMEAIHQGNANGRLISSSNVVPSTDEREVAASTSGKISKSQYWDQNSSQNAIIILIMCAIILLIISYCLWGTARRRYLFRRQLCPCFVSDDMTISSGSVTPRTYSSTGQVNQGRSYRGAPTIILLPQGRMLVVDGSVIAQFRADTQGVDLMELGQSIAWQRHQSTPSILSSTDSKDGISPIIPMTRFSPPSYESLFGNQELVYDLPPSYSEINFQLQQLNNALSREFSNFSIRTVVRQENLPFRHTSHNDLPTIHLQNRRYRSEDLLENGLASAANNVNKAESEGNILSTSNNNAAQELSSTETPVEDVVTEPLTNTLEVSLRVESETESSSNSRQTCTIQNKPFDENIRESRV